VLILIFTVCVTYIFQNNNGIQSNGVTWGGETIYYFGVALKELPKALDCFVNLFISPTMSLRDIQKERDVVDAGKKNKLATATATEF
jgi:secreted Zn-dependent insulinase-like peptidase